MILVAYRHGLRASELVDLRWDQIDFATRHPARPPGQAGHAGTHPILGDELRALRRLQREQEPKSPFVFTSERGSPFTTAGFARMVERAGEAAKLGFKAHPHMLRHACGFALANKGHDTRALQAYLGHSNIQHTVRYTELSPIGSRTSGDDGGRPGRRLSSPTNPEPSPRNTARAARAANRRPLPATKSPAQPDGLIAKKRVTRREHQAPAEPFPSIRRRKVRRATE